MDARKGIELLLTPGITVEEWERLEQVFSGAPADDAERVDVTHVLGRFHLALFGDECERQYRAMQETGARLIFRWEDGYPAALHAISLAPPALFVRGQLPPNHEPMVAIVGTRKPSAGGSTFAHQLAKTLSLLGVVVVSGMARGIDTAAHLGALAAGSATVAVLGTGVDVVYPPENGALMERIAACGAVVSEQMCGMPPHAGVFPRRNRIISGMCDAVVVVEGGVKSGALITARWALDQGRDVGAVPGFPGGFRSEGPNHLLKHGAFVVENAMDVVHNVTRIAERIRSQALALDAGDCGAAGLDGDAARVYDVVADASGVDDVAAAAGISVQDAQSLLTMLEIEGRIRRDEAGSYARVRHALRR